MMNALGEATALTQMVVDWLWAPLWMPAGTAAGMAVAVALAMAASLRRTYAFTIIGMGLFSWIAVLVLIMLRVESGFFAYIAFIIGSMLPAPGLTGLLVHGAKAAIIAADSRPASLGLSRVQATFRRAA